MDLVSWHCDNPASFSNIQIKPKCSKVCTVYCMCDYEVCLDRISQGLVVVCKPSASLIIIIYVAVLLI